VKATQDAGKGTFRTFYFSLIAGIVYLVLTTVSNGVLIVLTRRYAIGTRKAAL
jgi:histidine transport system permease protein